MPSLFEQMRGAIGSAMRCELDRLRPAIWQEHYAGRLTGDEAQALAELEAARRKPGPALAVGARVAKPRRSAPRKPGYRERRRELGSGGYLPPALRSRFTEGERAVLAVIGFDVAAYGSCEAFVPELAARAGVSETTVRNAVRQAKRLSLIGVTERRVTAWRNLSNVVTILSPEWRAWLRLGAGGGCKAPHPFGDKNKKRASERSAGSPARLKPGAAHARGGPPLPLWSVGPRR